ncbi:hypothetical protein BJ165DRAFT_1410905 [Panaeolus papilionaceus]|nr:hypothetical protein BJ165DRAFT_1410905 [Panaeolus papilionaceus]
MSIIPEFATKLKKITISGAVSVERATIVGPIDGSESCIVFVLLGPTGSGKSTRFHWPIYLVDVPGFADTKISSMGIVSMLRNMIQANNNTYFRILYFTPIHNPRLPGSQRRVLQTFEALTGPMSARKITIVSTMWDLVWGESALRRAESNFSELRDKIWEPYIWSGSCIVRFQNTQESALTILDGAWGHAYLRDYLLEQSISWPLQQTPFASNLYNDLQIQIQGLQLQQTNIQLDLQDATEQSDEQLIATLIPQFKETQRLLVKFEQELRDFKSGVDTAFTPEHADAAPISVVPTPEPSKSTPVSIPTASESTPVPVAPTPLPPPTSALTDTVPVSVAPISNLLDPIPGSVTPTPQPSESTPVLVLPTPDHITTKKGFFGRVVDSAKRLEKKLHRNRDR